MGILCGFVAPLFFMSFLTFYKYYIIIFIKNQKCHFKRICKGWRLNQRPLTRIPRFERRSPARWHPHQDSNLDYEIRSFGFYPLNYEGLCSGASNQSRTGDLFTTNEVLCHLSYESILVPTGGLEPTTLPIISWMLCQLSYAGICSWRRRQESNLQPFWGDGFQDRLSHHTEHSSILAEEEGFEPSGHLAATTRFPSERTRPLCDSSMCNGRGARTRT